MEKQQLEDERLRLMVFKSAYSLGQRIDEHLLDMYGFDKDKYTFILPLKESFFSDGHLKVEIGSTVRQKDLFLLTDVENYSITYNIRGLLNHASPNDLFTQLKDGIGACDRHSDSINVIMPILFAGRQHRRNTRESLACGQALVELENLPGVKKIITFDAHDPGVEHALRSAEFDNFFATDMILEKFIEDCEIDDLKNMSFVAPDNGATGRRSVYLNSFNYDHINRQAGSFYKQRDYNNLVDGKYPVISHDYCGNPDLTGMTVLVTDDMVSSGGSMFDVMIELKKRNAAKVYIATTFALFTEGIKKFDEYYEKGLFDGYYTTDLTYIPEEYQTREWLHVCDCSKMIAEIIYCIHEGKSISSILRDRSNPIKMLEKKFTEGEGKK